MKSNFVDKPEKPLNLRILVKCLYRFNVDATFLSETEFLISGKIYRLYNGCLVGSGWKHRYFNIVGVLNILLYERVLDISNRVKNSIIYDYQIEEL